MSRIAALTQGVERFAGGQLRSWESEDLSTDAREEFWGRILDFETAPSTTNFDQLIEAGVELPAPETLDETQLHRTLWTVITALANLRVFITHTDHLSDRDLYVELWHRTLREEVPDVDDDQGAWHVDILGRWGEGDTQVFLRHYADDKWRHDWLEEFPGCHMPPHEDPAYDRDRHLPKPYEGVPLRANDPASTRAGDPCDTSV